MMWKNDHPVFGAGIQTHNPLNVRLPQIPTRQGLPSKTLIDVLVGSGCGSVGRAVASNTRGLRFESSHWQNLYCTFVYLCNISCIEKTIINKKRPGMAHFLKNSYLIVIDFSRSDNRIGINCQAQNPFDLFSGSSLIYCVRRLELSFINSISNISFRRMMISVTRLGDLLVFGQLFKAFGSN